MSTLGSFLRSLISLPMLATQLGELEAKAKTRPLMGASQTSYFSYAEASCPLPAPALPQAVQTLQDASLSVDLPLFESPSMTLVLHVGDSVGNSVDTGSALPASRGLGNGHGSHCTRQNPSFQHSHLRSGCHSNLRFLCTAGRYTPLLGKCPPDYSHLENRVGEFHLLSGSANEETHRENRTSAAVMQPQGHTFHSGSHCPLTRPTAGWGTAKPLHAGDKMFPPCQMSSFLFLSSFPMHRLQITTCRS